MATAYGRILSIDDEPVIRESMVAYLEDSGFEVFEAENGEQGLEVFRKEKPDLVLSDLQMPGLSGLQVLDAISRESPETPVIMVSGAGVMDDAIEALRLGAWDYIVKPITDMTVLEHSVCKALERARLIQENKIYREELESANTQLRVSLRELEEDQKAGRQVQMQILPDETYIIKEYCFEHRVLPSLYLSGDFVDYFEINPSTVAFYIADVSGHGASSAFVTVLLKSIVSQALAHYRTLGSATILHPDQLLTKISLEMLKNKLGKYLTMVYGVLDLDSNQLNYSIGGHYPSPILTDGVQARFLEGKGFAVGIYEKAHFESHSIQLPEKFSLVMFSDGIMEVIKGKTLPEQEKTLMQSLNQLYMEPNEVLKTLEVHVDDTLPDDITLFMVHRGK